MNAIIPQGFTDPQTMDSVTLEIAIISARVHSDTDEGAATWADIAARVLESRVAS
jgi:hypothetical protein